MNMFVFKRASLPTALIALSLSAVQGSIFTISDDRIRNMDITPVLGRGYSIMTNQFHSTCLMVDETTVPSYNYDYFFTDFTQSTNKESELEGKLSGSFAYGGIKGEVNVEGSSTSKSASQTHMVTATMRIERYYSSVREEVSPLADDAYTLLDAEDYVGFFKACGPNYVRSLRRAQEVTAIFKMTSSSRENAKQFAAGLKVSGWGAKVEASFAAKSKFKQITSSLEIKILGYGLGLSQEGSETLVATSLNEYNEVMKFAFKSMTRNEDAHHIGMVYGMEVSPWVHNTAFQVAAKMQDENIVVPLPRSLIPKAYLKDKSDSSTTWANDSVTRDKYRCKEISFEKDKYGYCCEEEALFDYANQVFDPDTPEARVCRPSRNLDKSLVKDNMANNGEFVSRLDSSMRYRLVQLSQAEKCISAANSIPKRFDFHILKAQDTVKYDRAIEVKMTLFDLKRAVDPVGDFSIIKHLSQELDEWIEMYYSPCMAALYGTNVGTTPDTDVSFFMAYPWHSHQECMYLSCLAPNMRWDRDKGGCTPGLITGSTSTNYKAGNSKCASDPNKTSSASEQCKHDTGDLDKYHDKVKKCWDASTIIGSGQVSYFIEHFCLPQLTGTEVDASTKSTMITNAGECDGLNYVPDP